MGCLPGRPSSHHNSGRHDGRTDGRPPIAADDLLSFALVHRTLVCRNNGRLGWTTRSPVGRPLLWML